MAPKLSGKNFINTADLPREEVLALIDYALKIKAGEVKPDLKGKLLAAMFFNPSLRTRTSFASAMFRMGGLSIDLVVGGGVWGLAFGDGEIMDGGAAEHVKEAAPVLGRYCDAVAVRSSELIVGGASTAKVTQSWEELKNDMVVNGFARYAEVPVVNMESNMYHPCQGLGDALTIVEKLPNPQNKKYVLTWAYHPKALPMATPHSQMLAACDLGMDVVIAHPPEWALDDDVMAQAKTRAEAAGGSLDVSHDMADATEGATVVCAKSWGAKSFYGDWDAEGALRDTHRDWMVSEDIMAHTNGGLFMHCLPVRRNVVVSDAVIDSPNSIVIDQAENRQWAQMAILASLLSE